MGEELLTLWRLRTSRPGLIHIEATATESGVVTLCGFEIPATAEALTSRQPESRTRHPDAPMCAACMAGHDRRIRMTNPNQD